MIHVIQIMKPCFPKIINGQNGFYKSPVGKALLQYKVLFNIFLKQDKQMSLQDGSQFKFNVSFITCTLNSANVITSLLASINSQVLSGAEKSQIEWIFVDGESTDATCDLIRSSHLPLSTTIITSPPRGISDAFNCGVKCAQGKWIVFIGSDDYLSQNDSLSRWIRSIDVSDPNTHILYSDGVFEGTKNKRTYWSTSAHRLWASMSIFHPGTAVHKSLFDEIGYFSTDLKVAMDYDWILRALKHGATIRKSLSTPFVIMRQGGVSSRLRRLGYFESQLAQINYGYPKLLSKLIYLAKVLRFEVLSRGG